MTGDRMGTSTGASLRGTVALQHSESLFEAVVRTFESACGVQLRAGERSPDSFAAGIAAVVSMSGDVTWSAFVGLPAETAAQAAARFAGFPVPYDSGDMDDAVGELGNIIAGQAKAILDAQGVSADVSLPAVCRIGDFAGFIRTAGTAEFRCFGSELGDVWAGVIAGL